ncbi:MAG TPA: NADH-quinone oxidoreductase subunit C [Chloroflexi bacterium]|nr:NADH-quinone oxidoreductase subunit C [Chloroflexota bacterium]
MADEIIQLLKERFPEAIVEVPEGVKDPAVVVRKESIVEVARFLRDEVGFNYLSFMSGMDYPERFEVVYYLYSMGREPLKENLGPFVLKVYVEDKENPSVPTVSHIWPAAFQQEQEIYDMFGIRFEGHPDLRRIFMWEGFPGWPLRKDFENRTYTYKELEPTRPKPPYW